MVYESEADYWIFNILYCLLEFGKYINQLINYLVKVHSTTVNCGTLFNCIYNKGALH